VPIPSIRSITLACLTLAPALVIACDRDEDTEEARAAEQADVDDDDARGDHHKKSPADKLCAAVECTDAQRTTITGLLADGKRPERPSDGTFATANGELAGAFRDPDFEAADLAAWRDAVHGEEGPKLAPATIVAVHGALDARQRGVLADLLEDRGPGTFFGKRGKGGHGKGDKKGRGKGDKKKGGKHGPEFAVESLCERVSCTTEQRTQITTLLEGARPERKRDEAADKKMAAAFRGDSLAVADVEAYLDGMKKHHEAEMTERDAAVVSIHHLLTAEQRATLAADIAEHGPRGLIKGPGRHHGKRGKKGGEQPA
jgi:Spy/CpxP family protein refolding chaperone